MKTGRFQKKVCVLKPKNSMGNQKASQEAEAGARIRQAFVNELGNECDLDDLDKVSAKSNEMLIEFDYLLYLVAPIDCGDCIASLAIPNAVPLHNIVHAERRKFSFSTVKQSPGGISISKIPRRTLFPDINFGQASERIHAVQNITRILQFLHANKIAHNDLHPGNFLIVGNDYLKMFLIDFDHATCRQKFSSRNNDFGILIFTTTEYLFGTTKPILPGLINASWIEKLKNLNLEEYLDDPKTFSYTIEELQQIKEILLDLLTAMFV
ncbi:MAG: hypothetical protein LBD60_03435 [Puniceicoccales bacterium]|jgi:serine/threonine protein kinase|nr:hypothetical protein [Puniceicoccales bacterium]